jgi:hypothetical protein
MKIISWLGLFLLPGFLFAGDTTVMNTAHKQLLKGYKKLLYEVVLLHPKMNSAIERDLLKHYLLGSGSTYLLADSDFVRLQKTVPKYVHTNNCVMVVADSEQYCIQHIDLNEDAYFGWALGNINGIYQAGTDKLISLADIYDFNKAKKGLRTRRQEFLTRVFRFFAPRSAKAFVVTYNADGFILTH